MKYTIRPVRLPDDYASVAAILNLIRPDSTSADYLATEDRKIPTQNSLRLDENGLLAGFGRERVVAEDEAGHVVGYATTWRVPWEEPGALASLLCVRPEYRHQGIGSALAAHLESWAREQGATWLLSEVLDCPPESLPFAERRGFVATPAHMVEMALELSKFDAEGFSGRVDRIRSSGIRLLTLADAPGADSEQKLFDLFRETSKDNPASTRPFPEFKEWRGEALDSSRTRPDWVFIAADGDQFIGVSTLFNTRKPDLMYTDYTGVLREYRGRGIALALKLLSVDAAIAAGARTMSTDNEGKNDPMQAVNHKLGYVRSRGYYVIRKRI